MKRFLLYSGVVFLLLACAKSEVVEPADRMGGETADVVKPREFKPEFVPITFDGIWEANQPEGEGGGEGNTEADEGNLDVEGTKAYIDGSVFCWQTGDKVGVYDSKYPGCHEFTVTVNPSNPRYADISGEASPGAQYYAVYPASAAAAFSNDECTVTLPHVQRIAAGKYGADEYPNVDPNALLSITTADNYAMSFHNIYALLSFKLESHSDITHIQLIGNQGSVLAGTVTIDPSTGKMTAIKNPRTEIHLYPKSGESYFRTGVEYLIPILPFEENVEGSTYLDGFTLIMYTSSETINNTPCHIKRTDKSLSLARGKGQKLGYIDKGTGYASSSLAYANMCDAMFRNSSMVTFGFPAGSQAYRAAVYADAACTDLVVAHNISSAWMSAMFPVDDAESKWFSFGGLDAGRDYYFRGINLETGRPTMIRSYPTDSFTNKTMAQTASVGDVVLAEDFSELCYNSSRDHAFTRGASPIKTNAGTLSALIPYKGEIRQGTQADGPVFYKTSSSEDRMFGFYRTALPNTRLADWAEYAEPRSDGTYATTYNAECAPVCARNGLLKIGASKYTGGIVTPPLDFIPTGKKATISVKVKASRHNTNEKYLGVSSVSGRITPITPDGGTYACDRRFIVDRTYDTAVQTLDDNDSFKDYTLSVTAYPGSRIIIGADRTTPGTLPGSAQCRLYVSEITLTLTSLDAATTDGNLRLSNVSWSQGTVNWTSVSGNVYEVFLDEVSQGTVSATSTNSSKWIGSLHTGSTYEVKVVNTTTSSEVGTILMTTASIWQNTNSTGQRFVSIGWDQLHRTTLSGSDQCYDIRLSTSPGGSTFIYAGMPAALQGATTDVFLYGNAGVLGEAVKKGTSTRINQGDAWGGTLTCDNFMNPMGISIGGLEPGTTYYVQISTTASNSFDVYSGPGTKYGTYTLTHSFGSSGWSDWIAVTTDSPHIPADNELLYCGFDDFCIQQDFANRTVGSLPFVWGNGIDNDKTHLRWLDRGTTWNTYTFYVFNRGGHQTDTFNLGEQTMLDGQSVIRGFSPDETGNNRGGYGNINNVVVGDFAGWYCNQTSRPRMGQLHLLTDSESVKPFMRTPALTDAYLGESKKLSPSGTSCTLSFHAVYSCYRNGNSTQFGLDVMVYRAKQAGWETVNTIPASRLQPWGDDGVSDDLYNMNDYSKRPSKHFEVPLTLYSGDIIKLQTDQAYNDSLYGIIVDDILLVKN
ncbi:MAG: hypothetical protein IJU13_01690 [Bacteroidales bacterium]|nr:hypothetical protein [Bacteroidales bacterium]